MSSGYQDHKICNRCGRNDLDPLEMCSCEPCADCKKWSRPGLHACQAMTTVETLSPVDERARKAAEEIEKFVPRYFSDDTTCPKCGNDAGTCPHSLAEMLAAIIRKHITTHMGVPSPGGLSEEERAEVDACWRSIGRNPKHHHVNTLSGVRAARLLAIIDRLTGTKP